MSLLHLSTAEVEDEVMRLLTELAERKHAGDCDLIRVQYVEAMCVVEVFDFRPVSPVSVASGVLPSSECGVS